MRNAKLWRFSALCSAALLIMLGSGTVVADAFENGVWHMLHVGGNDVCEAYDLRPGCDKNYSATAIQKYDGSVSGQYIDGFYDFKGMHGVVECLVVQDNAAFVLGTVTSEGYYGRTFFAVLEDNGTSRQDPPDRVSWTFTVQPGTFVCDDWAFLLPEILADPFVMNDYLLGQVKIR